MQVYGQQCQYSTNSTNPLSLRPGFSKSQVSLLRSLLVCIACIDLQFWRTSQPRCNAISFLIITPRISQITGRRCEAKPALPRGGGNPSRTTRIFVARILPGVTDEAFKAHFEQYGTVQVSASCLTNVWQLADRCWHVSVITEQCGTGRCLSAVRLMYYRWLTVV